MKFHPDVFKREEGFEPCKRMEPQHRLIRTFQHTQVRKPPRKRRHGTARSKVDNTTHNADTSLSDTLISQDKIDDRQLDSIFQLHIDHI